MATKRFAGFQGMFIYGVVLAAAVAMPAHAATIVVDTPSQAVDGTDGHCSLPEAIYAANFDASIAIQTTSPDAFVATECTAGSGADTIQIVLPAPNVITMFSIVDDAHNPMGPTGTPIIFSNITIEGNGVQLVHGGIFNYRAFAVGSAIVDLHPAGVDRFAAGTGALSIRNAHIQGFTIKGGNGAGGGGGGLGAGGAIYVMGGALAVEACTFQANGVAGGNGSQRTERAAGGGGGLSGNGGPSGPTGMTNGGGGGGGGGARGNGSVGALGRAPFGAGGGGGGTVNPGGSISDVSGGGFNCGGNGGADGFLDGDDGDDGGCFGGGGGGGQSRGDTSYSFGSGNGGDGAYGGGGGGGGNDGGDGGDSDFGGGGGGSSLTPGLFGPNGGHGGFGGGGGEGVDPGDPGLFAGAGSHSAGGGGAALGGAIFNDGGSVHVYNCTFVANFAAHGTGADHNGQDSGAAIFSRNGSLEVVNATVSGNEGTGADGGIVAIGDGDTAGFELRNTIIYGNGPHECRFYGDVSYHGSGNLIGDDFGCTGLATGADPLLGPLQLNAPGSTPTMAIDTSSPAFDAGDDAHCLPTDQRGVSRPKFAHCDIGAYEDVCHIVSCPADVVRSNDANQCGAVVTYDDPTVDGTCKPSCSLPSGSFFPVGATTLTCTADEGSCSFTVTVNDTQAPTVAAPGNITVSNDPGLCSAKVVPGTASANDNCPGVTVNGTRSDGGALSAPYPVGTTIITWTATDAHGNPSAASAAQSVKVNDTEPPALSTPTSSPASLWPPNHRMKDVAIGYTATDNCPGTLCGLAVASSEPANGLGDGDTAPDWMATDSHHEQLRAERSGLGNGRTYTTTVTCTDTAHNATSKSTVVRVAHDLDAPAAASMYPAGSGIKLAGHFQDEPGATHAADWTLDGTHAAGTIVEPTEGTPGSVLGSLTLATPGVYSVRMNVMDEKGDTGTASVVGGLDSTIVVYPSTGGYIAGGGWINMPRGAYPADPAFVGKASFAFVSTSSGSAAPTSGELELDLHRQGFKFNAVSFESQTVSGSKALLRGTGTVNGAGKYKFLLATISSAFVDDGANRIRLKIWNGSTGAVIYDTQMGAPDTADPTTSVGGPSGIVIKP